MSPLRRILIGCISLVCAAVVWLSIVHVFFAVSSETYRAETIPPLARALAKRHLANWRDPSLRIREIERMRISNAEWDFMGRSFFVWALANMALRDASFAEEALRTMDAIIEETLRLEKERGVYHFLMDYAKHGSFLVEPVSSQFLDGEIAMMLAARRMIRERESYRSPLAERISRMIARMERSPALSAESYPDECWTFCNTVALAAIRLSDVLDGTDHSAFLQRWVSVAKEKLLDRSTGLLVSSYSVDGSRVFDGPEGSTIWMCAHCLQVVDESFARDQYERARKEIGRQVFGFGYAREWPPSWEGPVDIDSGPVIPWIGVSAGASGLAFLGAASFDDEAYLGSLWRTLEFAAFPIREGNSLRYGAGNQVGDAVLLYSVTQGPLWDLVKRREKK